MLRKKEKEKQANKKAILLCVFSLSHLGHISICFFFFLVDLKSSFKGCWRTASCRNFLFFCVHTILQLVCLIDKYFCFKSFYVIQQIIVKLYYFISTVQKSQLQKQKYARYELSFVLQF